MKRLLFFIAFVLIYPLGVHAQKNQIIDSLLLRQLTVKQIEQTVLEKHPMLATQKISNGVIEKPRKSKSKSGLFFLSITLLFVFAGLKQANNKHLGTLFDLTRKLHRPNRYSKEQLSNNVLASFFFTVLYLCALSYLLYSFLVQQQFKASYPKWQLLLLCLLGCLCFYFIKNGLQRLLSWVFLTKEVYQNYQTNQNWTMEIASMILFPLCVLLLITTGGFNTLVFYVALCIVVVVALFRYVKMLDLLKKILSANFVYFFIYLCAFEILPAVAIIKFGLAK